MAAPIFSTIRKFARPLYIMSHQWYTSDVSFAFLAFFSEIRQSIVRDGNYAIIFLLILGIIAAAFIGYLLWDGIVNRINSLRRRRKRHARRLQHQLQKSSQPAAGEDSKD